MRILLVHPEDSPRRGPWSKQHWDLIVDLGKSSCFSQHEWAAAYRCRVLGTDASLSGIATAKKIREIFSAGRGSIVDSEGIDWWDLASLIVAPQALSILQIQEVAPEINSGSDVWATRTGEFTRIVESLIGRSVRSFADNRWAHFMMRGQHYASLFRRFSAGEFKQIGLDKYDSDYRWRARWARRMAHLAQSVVLLPSAYVNVSRMAAAYAQRLPTQSFLMIATRESARQFVPPANVVVRDLAMYVRRRDLTREISSLLQKWEHLRHIFQDIPLLRVMLDAGALDSVPARLRSGLNARDAWTEVLQSEPVQSVLCGDDSNLFTRLPVLLAARKKMPTIDFHHGALDGRYLLKDLPCDVYFAKNPMEKDYLVRVCGLRPSRIVIEPPKEGEFHINTRLQSDGTSAIFFSEPYEAAGMRAEEVYREVLPPLCHVLKACGRSLILKLHPFESRAQRERIIRKTVPLDQAPNISILDGPLTTDLLAKAWFGITVESTTVIDCLRVGVPCFLCGWLSLSPYGYVTQYERFGIGDILHKAEQIVEIPHRVEKFLARGTNGSELTPAAEPGSLRRWLTAPSEFGVRSVS